MNEQKEKLDTNPEIDSLASLEERIAKLREPLDAKQLKAQEIQQQIVNEALIMVEGNEKLSQANSPERDWAPAHIEHKAGFRKDRDKEIAELREKIDQKRQSVSKIEQDLELLVNAKEVEISDGELKDIRSQIWEIKNDIKNIEEQKTHLEQTKSPDENALHHRYGDIAKQMQEMDENRSEFAVNTLIALYKEENPDLEIDEKGVLEAVKKILNEKQDEFYARQRLEEQKQELQILEKTYENVQKQFIELQKQIDERIKEVVQSNDREILLNPNVKSILTQLLEDIEKELGAWLGKKAHAEEAAKLLEALMKNRDHYREQLRALSGKFLDFRSKQETPYYSAEENLVLNKILNSRLENQALSYGNSEAQAASRKVAEGAGVIKKKAEILSEQIKEYGINLGDKIGTGYAQLNKVVERGKLDEYRLKLLKNGVQVNIYS